MRGRRFLDLAREVLLGATEVHWRGAAIHAYYALMLECRDAQIRWGFPTPQRQNAHATVRLRFAYAGDGDLQKISDALDTLVQLRNKASYQLTSYPEFSSDRRASFGVQLAANNLALLDAVEADPARRAAAIASIRP
jgi:hypothetical protein